MEGRKLRVGQVVRSNAGRDSGHFYVVVELLGEDRVALADGVRRKMANPKKKNVKHVKVLSHADEPIKRKLAGGEKISDADVRNVLRALVEEEGCW